MFIFWVTLFKINLLNQKNDFGPPSDSGPPTGIFWLTQQKLFSLEPTTFGSVQSVNPALIGNTQFGQQSLDIKLVWTKKFEKKLNVKVKENFLNIICM